MLNPRTIETAMRSASRELLLIDNTGERGSGRLALRVRPGADESVRGEWLAIWWRDGRRQTGKLGRYPALSLRAARDAFAEEWRPDIEAGRDPRRARLVAAASGSVGELLEDYIEHLKRQARRSWEIVEAALLTGEHNAADALGRDRRASEVTSADVADWLASAFRRGARVAADRYRAYLHAAFQWAAGATHDYTRAATGAGPAKHFGLTTNPVSIVPRDSGANVPRKRALSAGELRALWWAVDAEGFSLLTAPAIRLLLATGQRVLDVLRAEVEDFDLKARLWIIPAHKRKVGEHDHVVPLPPQAMAIVRQLVAIRKTGYLFPCEARPEEPMPHQSINRALVRWSARAKIPRFQARDLRRTWKTLAGEAGLSKEIRDRLQGHALTDVSARHYDRYEYLREKRAAMATWSRWLARMVRAKPEKMNAR